MSQIIIGGEVCTGASAPAIGVSVGYFQTVAQLRAYASIFTGAVSVVVAGNQAANDGFGGVYSYDPASSAADDGYVTIQQTVNSGSGRWVLNNTLPIVSTVAALRALPSVLVSPGNVYVAGNATPGDGLGGIYAYNVASTAADDGYATIKQTVVVGAGRWILGEGATATTVNDLEADINAVITAGDLTPIASTPGQLIQSLKRIFGGNYTKFSASATLMADEAGVVAVDCTGGNVTITMTAAAVIGAPVGFLVARVDSSTNTLTVNAVGSDIFDPSGARTFTVAPGYPMQAISDGVSVWSVSGGTQLATNAQLQAAITAAAALAGSSSQQFSVAKATSSVNAPQASQIIGALATVVANVTSSRSVGTVYTNSSSRPLYVKVFNTNFSSGATLGFYINGVQLPPDIQQGGSDSNFSASASILVPPGATYEVFNTAGSVNTWLEY